MSATLSETYFLGAAVACLASGALIGVGTAGRRGADRPASDRSSRFRRDGAERAAAVLALLCTLAGLGLSVARRGGWPLTATTDLLLATAAGALLCHLAGRRGHDSRLGRLFFCAIVAGLVVWGMALEPDPGGSPTVSSLQQPWLLASHLALVLAAGAFVEAGSAALACLVTTGRSDRQADTECGAESLSHAVLLGLPLLTMALLLTMLGGLYTSGEYWSWTAWESWQLLVWLVYTALWYALVLLGGRRRRLWALASLGLILTLLMLKAMGGQS